MFRVSCLGIWLRHDNLNTWKVKIWLSQEQKELPKSNKKHFSLLHKCSILDAKKQTSKNVADTTFKDRKREHYIYLFRVNNEKTRTVGEMCSKSPIKTQNDVNDIIANDIVPVFPWLTLSKQILAGNIREYKGQTKARFSKYFTQWRPNCFKLTGYKAKSFLNVVNLSIIL